MNRRANTVSFAGKTIGDGHKPYFIADIAANHDGDLNRAFKLIELAKEAGADAAKFQNFKAATIVSDLGFKSLGGQKSHQGQWKKSVYEVYEDASVSFEWTPLLKKKCDEVGIDYFTSPYDFASVDHVDEFVDVYKIGSGDITWLEIIKHIVGKGKPVILATGASGINEVEQACEVLRKSPHKAVLMQCNTNYTAERENFKYINLNVLKLYAELFPDFVLGLSDHTHGHSTVLGSIALGATVVEKHFTDDNDRVGPDHKFSMNPQTWREMVERSHELFLALGDGQKRIEKNEEETAILQRRSLRVTKNLCPGVTLSKEHLFPLRPMPQDGIPPSKIDSVLGKVLKKNLKQGEHLKQSDVEI